MVTESEINGHLLWLALTLECDPKTGTQRAEWWKRGNRNWGITQPREQ